MDKKTRDAYRSTWVALKYLVPVTDISVNGTVYAAAGKRFQKKSLREMITGAGIDAAIAAVSNTEWNVTIKRQVKFSLLSASAGVAGICLTPPVSSESPNTVGAASSEQTVDA